MRIPVLACSLVAVGALSATSALPALGAATYYVSPDGSDANDGTTTETAFLTPHAAMAKAKAGDAVVLRAGRYALTNSVSCKAGVELRGETGNPRDVVLDAGGQFAVISSVDGGGTVASLTVSNGYAYANSVTGAGIHTGRMVNFSDAKKVISNCVITCCTYAKDPVKGEGNSGAALVLDANSRAIDCLISSCTNSSDVTSGGGGGVILRNGGQLINSTVERCVTKKYGGGIFGNIESLCATSMVVRGCIVRENVAGTAGGGIANVPTIRDCRVEGNAAASAGGVFYSSVAFGKYSADLFQSSLANTEIVGNRATAESATEKIGFGGGVAWNMYAVVTNFVVDSCVFASNTISTANAQCGGGGLYLRLNGIGTNVVVRNSLFVGNENLNAEGTAYGAAAYVSEGVSGLTGAVSVENCTFVRNRNRTKSTWALYVGANTAETNCVVALNLNAEGADVVGLGGNGNWQGNWGYSCFYPKLGYSFPETVFNGTAPKFRTGTWVPSAQSPLRDAGLTLGWMADAHDLQRGADGQALCARVVGAAVDIGCFEYAPLGGLLFLIR